MRHVTGLALNAAPAEAAPLRDMTELLTTAQRLPAKKQEAEDLEGLIRTAWTLMTPPQRAALLRSAAAHTLSAHAVPATGQGPATWCTGSMAGFGIESLDC